MEEVPIGSFAELHATAENFYNIARIGWVFRGQSDASWPVMPKSGRPKYHVKDPVGRFRSWRDQAIGYADLPENDWECLAVAQHHGLATFLLDWSTNPLAATFFAVSERLDKTGALYCYLPEAYVDPQVIGLDQIPRVIGYNPRAVTQRIVNQQGVFTAHPNPSTPLDEEPRTIEEPKNNLYKLTISPEVKTDIDVTLNKYGINAVSLFPDLDGLSRHVNWRTREMIRRRDARNGAA